MNLVASELLLSTSITVGDCYIYVIFTRHFCVVYLSTVTGHSIIPTAGEFQELLRIITGSSECPVEFSEFEVLYHGLTIALGSSPVDCTTDESQWTRLAVDWHSYQPDRHDQFERILRDQWSM